MHGRIVSSAQLACLLCSVSQLGQLARKVVFKVSYEHVEREKDKRKKKKKKKKKKDSLASLELERKKEEKCLL